MQDQTAVAVQGAEALLERKGKIEAVISNEVAGLTRLIADQLEAERLFRRLEGQAAIGEPAPGLNQACNAAVAARAALEKASVRLGGLRAQVGDMGTGFARSYDEVAAVLPGYNAGIVAAFAVEWEAASVGWREMLGRRAAIERVLGQPMDLPDALPAAVSLNGLVRPHETLAELAQALKAIGASKAIAERQLKPTTFYDRTKIYRLVSDRWESRGLAKGVFVVDATFEPGRLAQILELEHARPVLDRDLIQGVTDAAAKADAIDKAARAKEFADSEANLHSGPDKQTTRRHDLEQIDKDRERTLAADAEKNKQKDAQLAAGSHVALSPADQVEINRREREREQEQAARTK